MANASARHSDDQPAQICPSGSFSISELTGFIDDLIISRPDVICELNFRHWFHPLRGRPNRSTNNALLGDWCIENPVSAKLCLQTRSATKDPPKRDILSKAQNPV
jgi:hypothetical protein